jgi:integrase
MNPNPGTKTTFPFSATAIEALPAAAPGKRVEYTDARCPDLHLRVTSTGAKSFSVYTWNRERKAPERETLGPWPKLPLDKARAQAKQIAGAIAAGESVVEARAKLADEQTFAELFELSLLERRDDQGRALRPNSITVYRYLFKRHALGIASRKVSTLDGEDFARVIAKIAQTHPQSANVFRGAIAATLRFGKKRHLWNGPMMDEIIPPFASNQRQRHITNAELGALLAAADAEGGNVRDLIRLLLLTGCRRSNVEGAEWSWIDLDIGVMRIPSGSYKGRVEHVVPLVEPALEILERRRQHQQLGRFVFPRRNPSRHWKLGDAVWYRLLSVAQLNDVHLHDLRHVAGEHLARLGVAQSVIQKVLGHASLRSSSRYQSMTTEDARVALARVASNYDEIEKKHGENVVVPLRRSAAKNA